MSKNIKIQPEFDAKLKKLRIKTKFMNNFGKWRKDVINKDIALCWKTECLNTNNWERFIIYAFSWNLSPEGYTFWVKIARK